jgi:hypothetical protein
VASHPGFNEFRRSEGNFRSGYSAAWSWFSDIHHAVPENYVSSSVMLMVASTDSARSPLVRPDFLIGNVS